MKYRFPIKVSGFIEMDSKIKVVDGEIVHDTRVVIDQFDWEFSSWPRVSEYGDDDCIVQRDDGHTRVLNADANVVIPLREALDKGHEDGFEEWVVSRTVDDDIAKGTR